MSTSNDVHWESDIDMYEESFFEIQPQFWDDVVILIDACLIRQKASGSRMV